MLGVFYVLRLIVSTEKDMETKWTRILACIAETKAKIGKLKSGKAVRLIFEPASATEMNPYIVSGV